MGSSPMIAAQRRYITVAALLPGANKIFHPDQQKNSAKFEIILHFSKMFYFCTVFAKNSPARQKMANT